jgi:hypothetical protein
VQKAIELYTFSVDSLGLVLVIGCPIKSATGTLITAFCADMC